MRPAPLHATPARHAHSGTRGRGLFRPAPALMEPTLMEIV